MRYHLQHYEKQIKIRFNMKNLADKDEHVHSVGAWVDKKLFHHT